MAEIKPRFESSPPSSFYVLYAAWIWGQRVGMEGDHKMLAVNFISETGGTTETSPYNEETVPGLLRELWEIHLDPKKPHSESVKDAAKTWFEWHIAHDPSFSHREDDLRRSARLLSTWSIGVLTEHDALRFMLEELSLHVERLQNDSFMRNLFGQRRRTA